MRENRKIRQKKCGHHNKGFTLVEMIISMAILSILLSLSVFSLFAWQDWSNFNRENEYAQVLFIAAQNQLAEFGADGRLKEMQESLSGGAASDDEIDDGENKYDAVGLNLIDNISMIRSPEGDSYELDTIYPESEGKAEPGLYQDEIVSLRAETGDYKKYLDDPEAMKKNDPEAYWVFELLGSYVYDVSILNGSKNEDGSGNGAAICVEITPEDGQVFAVLYSDKNDRFVYLGVTDDQNGNAEAKGVADIADRTESYRKDRMVGYYGVDTLYAATKNEIMQPSFSSVKLYNKDTFYMTYRLSAKYRDILTSRLTYVMDLNPTKDANDKKLTLKLDGTKLKNKEHAAAISCPVSRYDEAGNEISIGEFPVLAWVEPDYTIHVVLDAADIQATTDLYESELKDIRSTDKAADTKFSKTYSFFRFGVDIDNVYASVTATGDGFTTSKTVSNFGNLNVFKNQGAKHTTFAGETEELLENGVAYQYTVTNARHLYNIRYIEDISYEEAAVSTAPEDQIASVTFRLKSDIDWKAFEQKGELYNSYDTTGNIKLSSLNNLIMDIDGNAIEMVTRYNCDFPSIAQVRTRDTIDGNDKKITGIAVSEISNALYGIYFSTENGETVLDDTRPTGFVNVNYGEIKDLKLDKITSYGYNLVGGFCGINAGSISGLETMNTDECSVVSGKKHVGGIAGFQVPTDENMEIGNLVNHALVEGVQAAGGILGMVRNDFHFSDIDIQELHGLSAVEKQLLEDPSSLTIRIHDCENYGAISGVYSSELRGIYTSGRSKQSGSTGKTEDDVTEPRYIGGIVGYCYNQDVTDTTKITIEECTSSPQYNSDALLGILSDDTKLNQHLKGVYVGGIVGYNYFGQINNSSTQSESGQEGYLFGYQYVGGIVGFNIGPASGIVGSNTSKQGENDNHVIAYEYAGGITGCNANVRDVDSENNDISAPGSKDPEKLAGILVPDTGRDLNVKIDNWINKGIVIAVHAYSGGITGYNSGYIYRCNSDVKSATADTYFNTLYSGDYSGGIAGYNNGIIGNTERAIRENGKDSVITAPGTKFSTVCYVKGHNYVGGIVGYNDVDSIVEDYEIASGYVLGDEGSCFVGGYAGLNASVDLLMNMSTSEQEGRLIYSNPNHVQGTYFVGGNIGGNIINMADNASVNRINGVFKTDNFLGILEGRAFVGGFVGYNLLFDNAASEDWIRNDAESYRGAVYIVQRNLIDAFEKSDASVSDTENSLIEKKEILDHLSDSLNLDIAGSDKEVFISGQGAENTKVSFGTISGDIYVGGVMGYNDDNTGLHIQNVENATAIEANSSIKYDGEQILEIDGVPSYRTTDCLGNDTTYTYSYTGGIIGKVSRRMVIDNCWNASSGTVTTKGTYTGGLCEVNEGIVRNCSVSDFGSSVDDYIGGLCGLNKNIIENCSINDRTVSGRNVVGGIAAENFGTISDIGLKNANMLVEGTNNASSGKLGVSGIYTGYNGTTGKIILKDDIQDVSITSGGRYVGLVVGINEGILENKKLRQESSVEDNLVIRGDVQGYQAVGGVIGLNKSKDASIVIEGFTNKASIIATNGNAGGIIGENQSDNTIQYCVNNAVVTASDEGNAGGITSVNNGLITKCYDYQTVGAPEGMCGGITAINGADGRIYNCYVMPENNKNKLKFSSTKVVGAVAAQNAGEIAYNYLTDITVSNETTVTGTRIGVVVGENLEGGRVYLSDTSLGLEKIENCQAIVRSNYCRVGGIAGTNAGIIKGTTKGENDDIVSVVNCSILMDKANIASLGGVAGTNTGSISDIAVDASVQGNLGSSETGYGGIAGCSGYMNKTALLTAQEILGIVEYPAEIIHCTFDGVINASGSSGAPVRIGGITGINGYGSKILNCYLGARDKDVDGNVTELSGTTYVAAGDYLNKTAESVSKTDTKSYSYTGGIAGDNYGLVSACDNAENSTDSVKIIGFAGETGGIVGYNYEHGIVSGYLDEDGITEHYLTTGKTWTVEQRCCGNDRGPGGIIGKSVSAEDISYVVNYAPVTCNYQSNNYVAGLVGILGQQYDLKTRFYKCENYGNISSSQSAGGLVGMLESNGADFIECNNWGNVYAKTRHSGGFLAQHYSFTVGTDFRHCANHGNISGDGERVGGFVGNDNSGYGTVESYLYDCVNTGIIQRKGGISASTNAGVFYGNSMSRVIMELCRNYNTRISPNGFVTNGDVRLKNCLDDSGITTNSMKFTPFGGANGWNTNLFYLDSKSETSFSHENYGVYFSFHEGPNGDFSYGGLRYRDQLKDPSYLFSEPDVMNKIVLYRNDKYDVKQLNLNLSYDDDSEGLDSFVVYFWNGKDEVNSAPNNTYSVTATYIYSDGTQIKTDKESATGYYDVVPESRVVLKNPSSDKKPVQIRVAFDNTRSAIDLRGICYIPAAEEAAQKEAVCTYLGKQNDTTFNLGDICRTTGSGNVTHNQGFGTNPLPEDVWYCYPNDVMDINWTEYTNYRLDFGSGDTADITFDVTNGENASGMDSFVFYLANDNTNRNATSPSTYYYDYSVTFTDKNGKTATTDLVVDAAGYDSGVTDYRELSKQIVKVPQDLDPVISSIQLHIKTSKSAWIDKNGNLKENKNVGKIYFRGFGWIPQGQTEEQKMAAASCASNCSVFDRIRDDKKKYMHLKVDNSGSTPYIYLPSDYDKGFYMTYKENNPISETYYSDNADYTVSETEDKKSGSRIDTYYDLDPKFMQYTEELCTVYKKLDAPSGLKVTEVNSCLKFEWQESLNAYGYEVYYEVADDAGDTIFKSDIETIGSLQINYSVKIENSWKDKGYHVIFHVRAINAYHFAHDEVGTSDYDKDYEKYDSDWSELDETVKKVLPKPKVHMEIVAGNRTTFILDNYDEYVDNGCTDCTIILVYNGKSYDWNVEESGKYRIPEVVNGSPSSPVDFRFYAKPNESLQDLYTTSAVHYQRGEGHGNNTLKDSDWYCTTDMYGFYGTQADAMEYQIAFTLKNNDTYLMTDITAYDPEVGASVVYDAEITHAANSYSGGGQLKLTSTLKNLPEEWFDEDKAPKITVRAYPYHSQFDIIHYGHDLAEGIRLDGTVEENRAVLADIYDDAYFGADSDSPVQNCIWDPETNDLKSGYLLQKQEDGTYNIIYSSVIELSQTAAIERRTSYNEPYREYYKYDVYYCIYSDMAAETNDQDAVNSKDFQESYWSRTLYNKNGYNNVTQNRNETKYVQEIQPSPVVDDTVVQGVDTDGHTEYTFKWDTYYQDTLCWNGSLYNNNNMKYLTNADAGLFATWDAYCAKFNQAGLANTVPSNSDGTARSNMLRLMNAYYYSYSKASYRVDLIGTTLEGKEVILDTITVDNPTELGVMNSITGADGTVSAITTRDGVTPTTYKLWDYECTFTDSNDVWGTYPKLTARIMRIGSLESVKYDGNGVRTDSNNATYILPRYTDKSIQVKLKMNTISKPNVTLLKEDGKYITNDLVYEVEWGSITDENQKRDLGGYLITVKLSKAADSTKVAKTHYYYVTDIADVSDTIGLDVAAMEKNGVVTDVTEHYTKSDNKCKTRINLSDYNTNDIVEISVKAVARTNAENYEDGADGVEVELSIPKRLKVPDTDRLDSRLSDDNIPDMDTSVAMDIYKEGIDFRYATDDYTDEKTAEISMAAAVYDSKAPDAETDTSVATDAWDNGALYTLYTKDEPLNLGYASKGESTCLDITAFERYPGEYAGKWLKIALQATSTTKIDSQWTDQDPAGETTNYVWIHIPKLLLNDVDLKEADDVELNGVSGDVVRYYYEGNIYNESQNVNKETQLATKTLCFSEDKNVDGYRISITGRKTDGNEEAPVYDIYLQRHMVQSGSSGATDFDGTWDVYLAMDDLAADDEQINTYPVCSQNPAAVWIGLIGKSFMDEASALIEISELSEAFTIVTTTYIMNSQIRYVEEEDTGTGYFLIVLPDVTMFGETPYQNTTDYFAEQVLVHQYITEGTAYTAGQDALYDRSTGIPE